MNANVIASLAKVIVEGAFDFMAQKAGVTVDAIKATIAADPTGNTARYFADLVAAGAANIDSVLASLR